MNDNIKNKKELRKLEIQKEIESEYRGLYIFKTYTEAMTFIQETSEITISDIVTTDDFGYNREDSKLIDEMIDEGWELEGC